MPKTPFFGILFSVGCLLILSGCGQKGPLYMPPTKAEIRFYSINDQQQQRQLKLVPGAQEPGCHNLPLTRAVYRVTQVGFSFCEVYAKKDCAPGSEYFLRWSAQVEAQQNTGLTTKITPGAKWLFSKSSEKSILSWRCQLTSN